MTEQDVSAPSARLAAALAAVQAELPAVAKNRTAEVQKDGRTLYTYEYADLADVSAAILPVLGKHGLAFTAFPGHQPNGKFGLRYFLLHSSGDFLDGFMEIDDKGGSQMVGGRLTYARRYTLCAVTGVAAEEDVDARGDGQARTPRRQPAASGQQSQRTAQRAKRATDASPAQAGSPAAEPATGVPAHQQGAGEALPPLPGEDELPLSAAHDAAPGESDSPGSERHRKLIGAVQGQFKRLGYTDDDRDKRLEDAAALAEISGITSLSDMTPDELSVVADTLSRQRNRGALDALLSKKKGDRNE